MFKISHKVQCVGNTTFLYFYCIMNKTEVQRDVRLVPKLPFALDKKVSSVYLL